MSKEEEMEGAEGKPKKGSPVPEDFSVIKGKGDAIYIMEGGKKRVIPDLFTYFRLGISEDEIIHLSDKQIAEIPDGEPIPKQEPRTRTPKAKQRLADLLKRM